MPKFELPMLPYAYDSLEPFIDEQTMHIHHDKHHQAYTDKLNSALEKYPKLFEKKPEELLKGLSKLPKEIREQVRNHGGGFVNHSFFWPLLKKDVSFSGEIALAINARFGNFEKFKEDFSKAALGQFGSGWAWLVLNKGKLEIVSTSNQDSPLSEGKIPLLTIDVWEHAYYLKYQNKRADYVSAFFNVINWEQVNSNFLNAKNKK
ncbi:MAG: superoxide dismutase [Candidatus ainarchaeum sp.]|nr:superoxide dismutase [Candidatus ainarchaeum sp.]